jgi:uncharacterized protein
VSTSPAAIDAAGPVRPASRMQVIDALRGFALCGILLINVIAMGGPAGWSYPQSPPDLHDPDWQVFWAGRLFVEGAMRALFSFLFGAGMLLFLRQAQGARGRNGLFMRRAGWLLLFGVANGTLLLWPGDILLIYGLAAFAILPFAGARPRVLLAVAAAVVAVLCAWSAADALGGHAPTAADAARWAADYARERAARLGGYPDNLVYMAGVSWEWTWTWKLWWWVLDAVAAMLVGMALLKLKVLTGEASLRTYVWMAVLGFAVAMPLGVLEAATVWRHVGDDQPLAEALLQPRRIALATGYIGAFMLLWRSGAARWAFRPLAGLGRVALSGYLGQSVLGALAFAGFGLGLWGVGWPARWGVAAAIMALELALAVLWLRRFRFGPMEWLWRWLTYGERPRLRKGPP